MSRSMRKACFSTQAAAPVVNKRLHLTCLSTSAALWVLSLPAVTFALQVTGLDAPHSIVVGVACDCYFISNIAGEPTARDNNGFITKLDRRGKVLAAQFIRGGDAEVTLHAPKGMVVVGHRLYVADLDTLRAFDVQTGKPLATVSFASQPGPVSLVDVTADQQGLLYVADTDANVIYRIDPAKGHVITVHARGPRLAGPRALAVHPTTGHLIAVSWTKGSIVEIAPDGTITEVVSNGFFTSRFRNLHGVDFDAWGNLYVSDFTAGKIWRMRPDGHFNVIAEYLPTPADIAIDRERHLILVPYLYSNVAEINGLELPAPSGRQKRTQAGPGLPAPKALSTGSVR